MQWSRPRSILTFAALAPGKTFAVTVPLAGEDAALAMALVTLCASASVTASASVAVGICWCLENRVHRSRAAASRPDGHPAERKRDEQTTTGEAASVTLDMMMRNTRPSGPRWAGSGRVPDLLRGADSCLGTDFDECGVKRKDFTSHSLDTGQAEEAGLGGGRHVSLPERRKREVFCPGE